MSAANKTYMAKKEDVRPDWYVIDADGEIVGRLASRIAMVLMGKHKPEYTPHVDCGDFVVVLNAERVRFGGKPLTHSKYPYLSSKMVNKTYERYTGYAGGKRVQTATELWDRHPERILQEAVRRMLPKSKLGRKMLDKLKLCIGTQHPHQAQQPKEFPAYV